jgi:hypothetical protein
MMVVPQNPAQLSTMLGFLQEYAGAVPTPDMHVIGWVEGDSLKIVVGFNGWLGSVCQMHVAFAPDWHFSPRDMLRQVFEHVFTNSGRKLVLGIVNSKNERAMKYDQHLGFREIHRIPGMHDDGGDIVVFGMRPEECRYLSDPRLEGETDGSVLVGHA